MSTCGTGNTHLSNISIDISIQFHSENSQMESEKDSTENAGLLLSQCDGFCSYNLYIMICIYTYTVSATYFAIKKNLSLS